MTTLLAYHSDKNLKAQMVKLAKAHVKADELVQGFGYGELDGKHFRGCAVGCTMESYRRIQKLPSIEYRGHGQYESYLGVPVQLAYIEDRLFENLPKRNAQVWPTQFLESICPGADLSMVWPAFVRDLLANPKGGVQKRAAQRTGEHGDKIRASISAVVALFDRWLSTGVKPEIGEWREARRNAAYAAYAAAAAAYAAAADADARKREYVRQSKMMLKLLKAAPVRKVQR